MPLDFSAWSLTGVGGDARPASVALGARLWATCVEEVAGLLTAASQRSAGDPWPTDGPQL